MPLTLMGFHSTEVFPPDPPELPLGIPAPHDLLCRHQAMAPSMHSLLTPSITQPGAAPRSGLRQDHDGGIQKSPPMPAFISKPFPAYILAQGARDEENAPRSAPQGKGPRACIRRQLRGAITRSHTLMSESWKGNPCWDGLRVERSPPSREISQRAYLKGDVPRNKAQEKGSGEALPGRDTEVSPRGETLR